MKFEIKEKKVDNCYVMCIYHTIVEMSEEDGDDNIVSILQNNYPRVRRMSYDQWYWPSDMYHEALQFITYANLKYNGL
jgi:hypothetical protein